MRKDRRETAHQTVAALETGQFRERRGYATWRPRGTGDWLLILTVGGSGRFRDPVVGGEHRTAPGELILLRPGTPHDYAVAPGGSEPSWELLWAHFQPRPAWHDWLRWPERWPGFLHLTLDDPGTRERVTCRLADAHALWSRGDLGGGAGGLREMLAMNALEEALLWCDTENPLSEQARMHPKVRAAMDFLSRNLAAKVTLDDAASACGLSVSRLSHLFREQVGTTPQQFLERLRLDRARQLLELTGRSVASVAAEVGFDSPFYFSSRFKKHTGFSPRDYRRRTPG